MCMFVRAWWGWGGVSRIRVSSAGGRYLSNGIREVMELSHMDIWGKSILCRGRVNKNSEARACLECLENREVNMAETLSGRRIVEDDFRKVTVA